MTTIEDRLVRLYERRPDLIKVAVIRKEKGKYCVKSPNNPDWNGGCYDSKGEAEKRLSEVEYFKHKSASEVGIIRHVWPNGRNGTGVFGEVECPNCGAVMDFRDDRQDPIICSYCASELTVDEYDFDTKCQAQEELTARAVVARFRNA